jgi:hypothetical protein
MAVVYTPHSYFFEREDLPRLVRTVVYKLEERLGRRTAVVAAVSPFEAEQAADMGVEAVYVPNIVRVSRPERADGAVPVDVLGIGRLAAQKDPAFFVSVKKAFELSNAGHYRWVWVGDGDPRLRELLLSAGIEVTGWLPRDQVLQLAATARAYLHSAAWEGSPITLLEMQALDVPSVVRSIRSTTSLGYSPDRRSPQALAQALTEQLSLDPESVSARASSGYNAESAAAAQSGALLQAYHTASATARNGGQL